LKEKESRIQKGVEAGYNVGVQEDSTKFFDGRRKGNKGGGGREPKVTTLGFTCCFARIFLL
jgi:hypothetical protein